MAGGKHVFGLDQSKPSAGQKFKTWQFTVLTLVCKWCYELILIKFQSGVMIIITIVRGMATEFLREKWYPVFQCTNKIYMCMIIADI